MACTLARGGASGARLAFFDPEGLAEEYSLGSTWRQGPAHLADHGREVRVLTVTPDAERLALRVVPVRGDESMTFHEVWTWDYKRGAGEPVASMPAAVRQHGWTTGGQVLVETLGETRGKPPLRWQTYQHYTLCVGSSATG